MVNKTLQRIPRTYASLCEQLQTTPNHIDAVIAVISDQCQMFDLFIAQGIRLDRVFEINQICFNQLLVLALWCTSKIQRPKWASFNGCETMGNKSQEAQGNVHLTKAWLPLVQSDE
jgi:hypothetical protein